MEKAEEVFAHEMQQLESMVGTKLSKSFKRAKTAMGINKNKPKAEDVITQRKRSRTGSLEKIKDGLSADLQKDGAGESNNKLNEMTNQGLEYDQLQMNSRTTNGATAEDAGDELVGAEDDEELQEATQHKQCMQAHMHGRR